MTSPPGRSDRSLGRRQHHGRGQRLFFLGRYGDADYYYSLLQKEYPRSEHQFMAHLLGFKTKLLIYAGPDYDMRPLEEADVLAKQLLTQFPNELGEERQQILDEQARIVLCRAQREYAIGEYYYKNKYYTASKAYYQTVVDNWPDTQLAQTAKTKIEDDGKPVAHRPRPSIGWSSGCRKRTPARSATAPPRAAFRKGWARRRPAWAPWAVWAPVRCPPCPAAPARDSTAFQHSSTSSVQEGEQAMSTSTSRITNITTRTVAETGCCR